jgi:hypothetical protein
LAPRLFSNLQFEAADETMSYSWCYADDDLPLIIPNAVMFIPPAAAAAIPARLGLLIWL